MDKTWIPAPNREYYQAVRKWRKANGYTGLKWGTPEWLFFGTIAIILIILVNV